MLRLLTAVGGLLVLLVVLWLGGEQLAARRAAEAVAHAPGLEAAAVRPLRSVQGFGLRLEEPALLWPQGALRLPWAVLSAAPSAPLTARLALPQEGELQLGGAGFAVAGDAAGSLTLAPLRGMVVDAAALTLDDLRLDGSAMAEAVRLEARLRRLGHDAPLAARAGYDVGIGAEAISAGLLALLGLDGEALPGPVAAAGQLRLWLDAAPRFQENAPVPQVVGFQTQGLELSSGDLTLRLVGRLAADADGLAEGRLALFTRDADAIIRQLVALEVIPGGASLLLRAGLGQLGQAEFPEGDVPGPAIPAAAEGELRLPLSFADGQMSLGGVPLGPAPRLLP